MRALSAALMLAAICCIPLSHALAQGASDEWDDQAVAKAIGQGKAFLWSQWADGHWPETYGEPGSRQDGPDKCNYGGVTALCAYALLAAGEDPQEERMARTLEWLSKAPMHGVYARGFRANVWGMLGRSSKYRKELTEDVKWLLSAMYFGNKKYSDGSYPYLGPTPGAKGPNAEDRSNWDNSNSQIAVLGVWAGVRNGIEVPQKYWETIEGHWTKEQQRDGGWNYAIERRNPAESRGKGTGSMTAAGLATMFICLDNLHNRLFLRCRAGTDTPPIVKGLAWMDANFTARGNPGKREGGVDTYYLYGVERVGLASGYKYFGGKDWFKEGAAVLVGLMGDNGAGGSLTETAFTLLFLARGQHPVLFNKLKYDGMWNSRPRDLANLTRWISASFERPVNWQIVGLDTDVSDWHDAPILYISGASAPKFTPEQLEKLRTFVHQGGVLLSESACNATAFDSAMVRTYRELFPRYELKYIPADHPIYTLQYRLRQARPVRVVSNGVRPLAIHCSMELSNAWQQNLTATATDLFAEAANIFLYVTDKGSLRSRGVTPWPPAKAFSPAETVKVTPVQHDGNWDVEPLALQRFALLMGRRHNVKVELGEPVAIAGLDPAAAPVAVMTGTTALKLTAADQAALKKYLTGGGTLIADAAGSGEAFAQAMEEQLPAALDGAAWAAVPAVHPLYTGVGAGLQIEKVSYRRASQAAVGDSTRPRLRGLSHNGRLAVIFSPEDLTAGLAGCSLWGLKGYDADSAFALMRNAVLYASGRKLP